MLGGVGVGSGRGASGREKNVTTQGGRKFLKKSPSAGTGTKISLIFFSLPFLISLLFSFQGNPCFFECFLFFSRILGVRPRERILDVFVGFSLFLQNGKEKKIRVNFPAELFSPHCAANL